MAADQFCPWDQSVLSNPSCPDPLSSQAVNQDVEVIGHIEDLEPWIPQNSFLHRVSLRLVYHLSINLISFLTTRTSSTAEPGFRLSENLFLVAVLLGGWAGVVARMVVSRGPQPGRGRTFWIFSAFCLYIWALAIYNKYI